MGLDDLDRPPDIDRPRSGPAAGGTVERLAADLRSAVDEVESLLVARRSIVPEEMGLLVAAAGGGRRGIADMRAGARAAGAALDLGRGADLRGVAVAFRWPA